MLDDILVSVNGRDAENDVVASQLIREARGDVILKVRRQAVTTSAFIVTITKPDPKMRLGMILAPSPPALDGGPMPPRIYRLEPDGLALASRELFPGDVLQAVNGHRVAADGQRMTAEDHAKQLLSEAGAVIALTITRPQQQEAAGNPAAALPLTRKLAIEMTQHNQVRTEGQTLNINLAVPKGERLGVSVAPASGGGGVMVDELTKGSVGESCGVIHTGDIILAVDDVIVSTEKEARRLLGNVASSGQVKLTVLASNHKPVKPVAAFWG